jgi:hypothetical protein
MMMVDPDAFDELVADGEHRVQRRLRVLEDHRNLPPPDVPHLVVALLQQVLPFQQNLPLHNPTAWPGHQSQQREGCHGLAAA